MISYVVTHECDCGETIEYPVTNLTSVTKLEIPIDSLSQIVFECSSCDKKYFTGDVEVLSEDEI